MDNCNLQREKIREPYWSRLREEVGGECGEQLVEAMKDLYSIYTPDVIDWFASLYDLESGKFYYSASARDNDSREYKGKIYPLRADLESTCQALGFMETSGMTNDFNRDLSLALPKWMQDDIADNVYNMQDEDGYFYHDHWGKDIPLVRRSRDLMWANSILARFGREKRYASVSDRDKVNEVKNVVLPEHLQSAEAFRKYLEDADIHKNCYPVGNNLTCQTDLIKLANLVDVCYNFLNEMQLENGLWYPEECYFAINGAMKITCFYNGVHRIIPRAREIARVAIRVLLSDEAVNGAVDLFNPWFTVGNLITSLRESGEQGNQEADEILAEVRAAAPEAIRATARKVLAFKKESGSFSYHVSGSSHISSGMPTALPNSWEGDINGYILSATGLINHVYRGLGLADYNAPLFARCDFDRYMDIIEKRRINERKGKND